MILINKVQGSFGYCEGESSSERKQIAGDICRRGDRGMTPVVESILFEILSDLRSQYMFS